MKRAEFDVPSKLARFTNRCVALSQKAVEIDEKQPIKKGEGGYADWVIITLHRLREYLDLPYRRLLDILREMPDIVEKFGLSVEELPDFTTVCARKQALKMRVWRVLLRLSVNLFDTGEIQAIDSTSFAHRSSSHNYAKRVKNTFESVKTTLLVDARRGQSSTFTARWTSHTTHKLRGKSLQEISTAWERWSLTKASTGTSFVICYGKKASDQ